MKKKFIGKRVIKKRPIKTIEGVIRGSGRGFAFLSDGDEEIFIPAKATGGAMHGDTVEVEVYSNHGEVKRIIKEGVTALTGIYVREMRSAKVIPDDKRLARDVTVVGGGARVGDRVVVKLSHKDRSKGEIVAVLGEAGTLESDIGAVLFTLGVSDFKHKALSDAEKAASEEILPNGRRDFRAQPCFTIDGESSKDFDDAVYAEQVEGGYKLYVHIADVAHYVRLYGPCDKEAFYRGNSFYYGENVIPMLPVSLSNGVCSLNENVDRYTLSAIMDIDGDGCIVGGEIVEGIIRSHRRMTYELVEDALSGKTDIYAPFMKTLEVLRSLRDVLKRKRDAEGNIDFDIPEPKFTFIGGKVEDVKRAPRLMAHSIIEECMIAANRFVARTFLAHNAPFVYREHQPPLSGKLEQLNNFLLAMGESAVEADSSAVAGLLKNVNPDRRDAVSRMTLRAMSKAKYSTTCEGHFGLAIKEYCHFTSPIRRYSDLAIHRVIKAYLHGENLNRFDDYVVSAASQASEREKLCEKAERDIDELYIADYMARFVGQSFDGVVSGVTEWGVYVELDNTAEGMIRAESLGTVKFDEETMSMFVMGIGVIKLGDKLKVKLVGAASGNIAFELENACIK